MPLIVVILFFRQWLLLVRLQSEADTASKVDISSELRDAYTGSSDSYQYPSYFDAVIKKQKKHGISENDIVNNGYKIYTELDQYQTGMQTIFDNTSYFPTSDYEWTKCTGS